MDETKERCIFTLIVLGVQYMIRCCRPSRKKSINRGVVVFFPHCHPECHRRHNNGLCRRFSSI